MAMLSTRTRRGNPRATALVGGGLVLGLAAAVTLAAPWSNQAQADAVFGTGELTVQVRTHQGQAWREAADGDRAARLNFAVDVAGLAPGTAVYAPLSLRTDAGSTGGTVALEPAVNRGSGTLFDALEYGVLQMDEGSECGPDATGTSIVPFGSPLATEDTGTVELGPDSSDQADLCFVVALPRDLEGTPEAETLRDLRTTVQWQFTATPEGPQHSADA